MAGQGDRTKENDVKAYLAKYNLNTSLIIGEHHKSHAAAGYYTSGLSDATVVVIDSIFISFYLFNSLPHVHQPPLFCVCTSAFIVQCSTTIQSSIQTFQNGTRGPSPLCNKVSLSLQSVNICLFFYLVHFTSYLSSSFSQTLQPFKVLPRSTPILASGSCQV